MRTGKIVGLNKVIIPERVWPHRLPGSACLSLLPLENTGSWGDAESCMSGRSQKCKKMMKETVAEPEFPSRSTKVQGHYIILQE